MKHFDAIIIGTGKAGPSLAARFSDTGKTLAIIERHKFGGTCVNTGCIPTKTMVASAYAAHIARRGGFFCSVVELKGSLPMSSALERIACEWIIARGTKTCRSKWVTRRTFLPDTEACYEMVASQEEMYLETTEEELRASLTSEPTTAEHWRTNREKLELDWRLEIFDDGCK
jgi:cation diffusion facilitator CzcD-associated flavoprotein CzcO